MIPAKKKATGAAKKAAPVAPAGRGDYWRRRRELERGGPPREPKPHGTVAAARRHQRAGEQLCDACAVAWREHQAAQYRARKASRG